MSSSTTREMRREEYSTNVIRHLQPSRPLSPYSQKSDFDNNLDNILDDLQQSISRPGSSLGQPINNFSSHREVQYLQPANATTVLRERSLSPNSSANRIFKTSKYEYSTSSNVGTATSGGERGNLTEINKLDTLLSDLENERTATLDRNKRSGYSSNNIGIDSGLLEPNQKVIKTTTTTYTSKNPVARELLFDSPDPAVSRSIRHQSQSPSFDSSRVVESSTSSSRRNVTYTDDGLYGRARPTPPPAGSNTQYHVTETRTRTLSPTPASNPEKFITETRTINNELVPKHPVNEVVRVENTTGPEALQDIQLSDSILPRPKTKVTTTIRTYTYEIPDDGILRADRDPPKNNAMFYKSERNERNVNYFPTQTSPLTIQEVPLTQSPVPLTQSPVPSQQNVVRSYKYESHSSPQQINGPQQFGNVPPGGITIYPPAQPSTTIYKTETVTNQQYRAPTPTNQYLPGRDGPFNGYPQHPHQHPSEPSIIVQRTTTTRNVHRPVEREPPLHPFPVDGPIITEVDGSPPKRVEDLMASFGDTSEIHYTKKNVQIAERPLAPSVAGTLSHTQRNVYSSEPEDKNKNANAVVASRNVAGPPVYYPPNHELFTRKEESGVARAQGGWARGQGKYQYESSSKSKSSSKSGAAVVPLCCPLCCAMPCTIM